MSNSLKKILASTMALVVVASSSISGLVYAAEGASNPEWESAVQFMDDNGLSGAAGSVSEYDPMGTVKREAAAKLFTNFAVNVFGMEEDESVDCSFVDLNEANEEFQGFIISSCQLGILKGTADGYFLPKAELQKHQFLTVLARIVNRDSSIEPMDAFTMMKEDGITNAASYGDTARNVSRIELAILFQRATEMYADMGDDDDADDDDSDLDDLLGDLFGDDDDASDDDASDDDASDDDASDDDASDDDADDDSDVTGGKLEASVNPETAAAQNIPDNAQTVEFLTFDLAAGDSDVAITQVKVVRSDLGSNDDFDKVWLTKDGVVVSNDRSIADDDTALFNVDWTIPAGKVATYSVVAAMAGDGNNRINRLSVSEIEADASVEGLPIIGNPMSEVDYEVAALTLTAKGSDSTVDVGEEGKRIGEFELEETADDSSKNVILKSIRLKNSGSADLDETVENLALYTDGDQVSTETVIDGDYVTFLVDDLEIEDGKSKLFDIKADIVGGEDGETFQFEVKDDFDIYAIEEGTNIGADTDKGNDLRTYTINAGKVTVSKDTSSPSSEEYVAETDDVLVLVAKLDLDQDVTVEEIIIDVDFTAGDDNVVEDSFDKFKLYLNDRQLDSQNGDQVAGGTLEFDADTTLSDNDLIKIYVDIDSTADVDDELQVGLNSDNLVSLEYVSDGETVDVADVNGNATSSTVTVVDATDGVTIVRNDGYTDGEVFLAGENGAKLMQFVVSAGSASSLDVRRFKFDFAFADGDAVSDNFTNLKLLVDDSQVGSTEDLSDDAVTIEDINYSVSKNGQATFELFANIDTSTAADEFVVTLTYDDAVIYDDNNNQVEGIANVDSAELAILENAKLTVDVISTPSESLIVAGREGVDDVEVATFELSATDGDIEVTKLFFGMVDESGAATMDSDSSIAAFNLVVDGDIVDSRQVTDGVFYFILDDFIVEKDEELEISITADLNGIGGADETDKIIRLELIDIEAETAATSNDLEEVENDNTALTDAADDDLDALDLQSEGMYLRKTQATFVKDTLSSTVLQNGESTSVYKFTLSADATGGIEIAKLAFDVNTNGAVTTTGYSLYIDGSKVEAGDLTGFDGGVAEFVFADGEEPTISAQGDMSFELKADIAGVADGDSLSVKIATDEYAAAADKATAVATDANFVWSDKSGSPHSVTSADWFNGFRVNGLYNGDDVSTTLNE